MHLLNENWWEIYRESPWKLTLNAPQLSFMQIYSNNENSMPQEYYVPAYVFYIPTAKDQEKRIMIPAVKNFIQ